MDRLLAALGQEIVDPEEEAFLLFSQQTPQAQNLGFVDPRAASLEVAVAGKDFTISQSPGLLSSDREQGTTGAVLWKITPLFANWISSPVNILNRYGVLSQTACALELGCGVSGLLSLTLAPRLQRYVNTDQEYVLKYVRENVQANHDVVAASSTFSSARVSGAAKKSAKRPKQRGTTGSNTANNVVGNIITRVLDWETSDTANLLQDLGVSNLDMLVACDCIYNEALIGPLVSTMKDLCALSPVSSAEQDHEVNPTVCIIAQQLRSPDVFEAWLRRFHRDFHVWQVPDEELMTGLKEGSGFVIHVGVLRRPNK